jgi:hypothetical protein
MSVKQLDSLGNRFYKLLIRKNYLMCLLLLPNVWRAARVVPATRLRLVLLQHGLLTSFIALPIPHKSNNPKTRESE